LAKPILERKKKEGNKLNMTELENQKQTLTKLSPRQKSLKLAKPIL